MLRIRSLFLLLTISVSFVMSNLSDFTPCPGLCTGQGHCNDNSMKCECFNGFTGTDCSLRTCPSAPAWSDLPTANDNAHNPAECSNRGICDRETGKCICETGRFEGQACERLACRDGCNGRGRCESMKAIASLQDPGELITECSAICSAGNTECAEICATSACTTRDYSTCLATTTYATIWDAQMIYGCVCDEGYSGPNCMTRDCPTGDDPLTGTAADTYVSVNEKQTLTCAANGGTFTLTYQGRTTSPISHDASLAVFQAAVEKLSTVNNEFTTAIIVGYGGANTRACLATGNSITVEFLQNFGDVPLFLPDGGRLTNSAGSHEPLLHTSEVIRGTKEDDRCSNRGLCNEEIGVCECSISYDTSDGYGAAGQRGDCGFATTAITACPGAISCNAQGVCAGPPTYQCMCKKGYTGADCSELVCPVDRDWFGVPSEDETAHMIRVECSNAGTCDRETGLCGCMDGFEGGACHRMKCPGAPACNDHGVCLTMARLAELADDNGDETTYTYGAIPNDPATWDYDKIQGCLCGEGWEGYDCSMKSCPKGDDPINSHDQVNEVQEIFCQETGTAGTFILSFRQEVTGIINYNAVVADVEAALEGLSTITDVRVSLDLTHHTGDDPSTHPVCSATGTFIKVEFLSPTANVPQLKETIDDLDSFTITSTVQGTKEYIECSGRGLCDHETGLCKCVVGFTSSDGQGQPGVRNDCGHKAAIVVLSQIE